MKRAKLKKLIEDRYWKSKQRLYITPIEDWWYRPKTRWCFDIHLMDKNGENYEEFLFTIRTLDAFTDLRIKAEWSELRSFKRRKQDFGHKSLVVNSAHIPFYINQTFTLKKFGNITKEDIYNCTKYLVKKALKCFWVWNIEVVIPSKEVRI